MLPSTARLRSSRDFGRVLKHGRRVASRNRLFVLHVFLDPERGGSPRIGLTISRAVGNAVVRHRLARRLRHVLIPRLGSLPCGLDLVFRGLPQASQATSTQLSSEFEGCWRRLMSGPMGREVAEMLTVSS